jgi:hypothetical protein
MLSHQRTNGNTSDHNHRGLAMDCREVYAVVEEERKAAHLKVVEALIAEYEQKVER